MLFQSSSSLLLAIATLAPSVLSVPWNWPVHRSGVNAPRAIYFLANNAQNEIVSLPIGRDGLISGQGTLTPTGGNGGNTVNKTGFPITPDALASTYSVRQAGNYIFAVNAGSSTLSMFRIDPRDPTNLTPLGSPQPTNGDMPVTVDVSLKNNLACVGNNGARAGVACAKFTPQGLGPFDTLRNLPITRPLPGFGPTDGVGQVLFTPDESQLLTMIKGGVPQTYTGYLSVFPVQQGLLGPASTEVRNSPNGTIVLFSGEFIPGSTNLIYSDAAYGGGILSYDPATSLAKVTAQLAIPDQFATCWSIISPRSQTAYLTDVRINHLVEMDITTGAMVKDYHPANPAGVVGFSDLAAGGDFIYANSAAVPGQQVDAYVQVFDVSGGRGSSKLVQQFKLNAGVGANAQGMQVLM